MSSKSKKDETFSDSIKNSFTYSSNSDSNNENSDFTSNYSNEDFSLEESK